MLEHDFESAGRPSVVFVMFFANDVDADYDGVINGTLADRERRWRDSLSQVARMRSFRRSPGRVARARRYTAGRAGLHARLAGTCQKVLREFSRSEGIRFVNLIERFTPVAARSSYWDWIPTSRPAATAWWPKRCTPTRRISSK